MHLSVASKLIQLSVSFIHHCCTPLLLFCGDFYLFYGVAACTELAAVLLPGLTEGGAAALFVSVPVELTEELKLFLSALLPH